MAPTRTPALALGLATSSRPDGIDTMSDTTTTTTYPTASEWLASDRRGRNTIVRDVRATFTAMMASGDTDGAMAAMVALASYVVPTERPAVVIDWATIVRDRIATLDAAIVALRTGSFDGAPDGFTFDGSTDGATVDTDAVARLAVVRRATRRDLASHVAAVVTGEWMSVADVRRAIVADTDGAYVPSDGAVAAVLFDGAVPRTDVDGGDIVCTVATTDRPRGCYRP